jgi:hypothetical protein
VNVKVFYEPASSQVSPFTVGYQDLKIHFSKCIMVLLAVRIGRMSVDLVCLGADPRVAVVNRTPTKRRVSKVTDCANI